MGYEVTYQYKTPLDSSRLTGFLSGVADVGWVDDPEYSVYKNITIGTVNLSLRGSFSFYFSEGPLVYKVANSTDGYVSVSAPSVSGSAAPDYGYYLIFSWGFMDGVSDSEGPYIDVDKCSFNLVSLADLTGSKYPHRLVLGYILHPSSSDNWDPVFITDFAPHSRQWYDKRGIPADLRLSWVGHYESGLELSSFKFQLQIHNSFVNSIRVPLYDSGLGKFVYKEISASVVISGTDSNGPGGMAYAVGYRVVGGNINDVEGLVAFHIPYVQNISVEDYISNALNYLMVQGNDIYNIVGLVYRPQNKTFYGVPGYDFKVVDLMSGPYKNLWFLEWSKKYSDSVSKAVVAGVLQDLGSMPNYESSPVGTSLIVRNMSGYSDSANPTGVYIGRSASVWKGASENTTGSYGGQPFKWMVELKDDFVLDPDRFEEDNDGTYVIKPHSITSGDIQMFDGISLYNTILGLKSDKAPTSHASTATTYGAASDTSYGHVRLNNNVSLIAASGTVSPGSSNDVARADHVHPSDTSKSPTNHASTETSYGVGDVSKYGHVKLNFSASGTGTITPLMDYGTGSAGVSMAAALADHVHPFDTSRMPSVGGMSVVIGQQPYPTSNLSVEGGGYVYIKDKCRVWVSQLIVNLTEVSSVSKQYYIYMSDTNCYVSSVAPSWDNIWAGWYGTASGEANGSKNHRAIAKVFYYDNPSAFKFVNKVVLSSFDSFYSVNTSGLLDYSGYAYSAENGKKGALVESVTSYSAPVIQFRLSPGIYIYYLKGGTGGGGGQNSTGGTMYGKNGNTSSPGVGSSGQTIQGIFRVLSDTGLFTMGLGFNGRVGGSLYGTYSGGNVRAAAGGGGGAAGGPSFIYGPFVGSVVAAGGSGGAGASGGWGSNSFNYISGTLTGGSGAGGFSTGGSSTISLNSGHSLTNIASYSAKGGSNGKGGEATTSAVPSWSENFLGGAGEDSNIVLGLSIPLNKMAFMDKGGYGGSSASGTVYSGSDNAKVPAAPGGNGYASVTDGYAELYRVG